MKKTDEMSYVYGISSVFVYQEKSSLQAPCLRTWIRKALPFPSSLSIYPI